MCRSDPFVNRSVFALHGLNGLPNIIVEVSLAVVLMACPLPADRVDSGIRLASIA
jgi:hypothetical protein